MFRYRLHLEDGGDVGEATYAQMIQAGPGARRSSPATTSTSASSTLSRSMRRTSCRSLGSYRSRRH